MKNFDEFNIMTLSAYEMLDIFKAEEGTGGDAVLELSYDFNNKNVKNTILQSTDPYGTCGMLDQLIMLLEERKAIDLSRITDSSERKDILRRHILFVDFSAVPLPDVQKRSPGIKELEELKGARAAYMLGAFGEEHIGFTLTFEREDGKEPETVRFVPFEKSASMARGSQISFIDIKLLDGISERLNIGIDFSMKDSSGAPLVPVSLSKFYAYRGLYFTDGKRICSSYEISENDPELEKLITITEKWLDSVKSSEKSRDKKASAIISALIGCIRNDSLNPSIIKKAADSLNRVSGYEAHSAVSSLISRCSASLFVPDENSVIVLPSNIRDIRFACKIYTVDNDENDLLLRYDANGRLEYVGDSIRLEYDADGNPDENSKQIIAKNGLKKYLKISSEPFDGEGLISPDCAMLINAQLQNKGYKKNASSFQIRMPFIKGVLHEADFSPFLSSDKNEFDFFSGFDIPSDRPLTVIDAFDIRRDLRKAKIIINTSMFKGEKWLREFINKAKLSEKEKIKYAVDDMPDGACKTDPMKYYFDYFKKYNHGLYISNTDLSIAGKSKIKLNYQFLNTLDLYEETTFSLLPRTLTVSEFLPGIFSAEYAPPLTEKYSVRFAFTQNQLEYTFDPGELTASGFRNGLAAFLTSGLTPDEQSIKDKLISFVCGSILPEQKVRSGIYRLIEAQKEERKKYKYEPVTCDDSDETDAEQAGISFNRSMSSIDTAIKIDSRFLKDPRIGGMVYGKKKGLIGDIGAGRLTVPGEQRFLSRDLLSLITEIFRSTQAYKSAKNSKDEASVSAIRRFKACEERFKLNADKVFLPGSRIKMRSDFYYAMLRNPHLSREEHCALRPYSTLVSLDRIIVSEKGGKFILNRKFKTDKESGGDRFSILYGGRELTFSSDVLKKKRREYFAAELKAGFDPDGCGINEKLIEQILIEYSGRFSELCHVYFHNLYFKKLDGTVFIGFDSLANDTLSGADFDGDIVKICADPIINKAVLKGCYTDSGNGSFTRKSYIISIPGSKETWLPVTRYPRYSNIRNSFSNKIGHLSNSAIKIGKAEYCREAAGISEISKCAKCTVATGLEIDAAKTGIHPVALIESINDECSSISTTPLNLSENDYFIDFKDSLPLIMQTRSGLKLKSLRLSTYFADWFGKDTVVYSLSAPNIRKRRIYDFSDSDRRNIPSLDILPYACAEMMCSRELLKSDEKYAVLKSVPAFCEEKDGCTYDPTEKEEVRKVIEAYNSVLAVSFRLYRGNEFRKKIMQKNAGTVRNIIKKQYDDISDKTALLDGIYGKLYFPEDDFYFERCRESIEKLYELNWIFIPTKELRKNALDSVLAAIFGGVPAELTEEETDLLTNFNCGGYMLLPHILTDIAFSQDIVLNENPAEGGEAVRTDADNIYYNDLYKAFLRGYNNKLYFSGIRKTLRNICVRKIKKIIGTDNITAVIKYCWALRSDDCDRNGNFFWNCFRPEEIECWLREGGNGNAQ